jgi:RNA polymerase sigma-70 factor (ECF subfamily)
MDKTDTNKITSKPFVSLLVPNQTRIQAFILTLVPNANDAEDIYQETVSTMWDKFPSFEIGTDFVSWAITIAKFKVLEFRGRQQKTKVQFSDTLYETLELTAAARLAEEQDRLDALKTCVGKLSEKEQNLLKMRYEMDLTFQKMAQRIGKTAPALHRIMAIIHSRLALCIRRVLREETLL